MKIRYPQPINSDTYDIGLRHEISERALVEAIALTAEICGHALSPAAARMLAGDLGDFNQSAVLGALARCRMERHGPLKVADILARIDDGRPGAEEAWAMMPKNELASVVWTEEMAQAWGVASPLLDAGDISGARTVFQGLYDKAVLEARIRRHPVRWTPSLGSDTGGRESVLIDAMRKRRLSPEHVAALLPPEDEQADGAPASARNVASKKVKQFH